MQVRKTFIGLLLCVVVCLSGFVGYSVGVGAAPDFSDYYLDQSVAPYSYMICTDNSGWYWAVNGSNGAVCWTSTNASYTIQQAVDNGKLIKVNSGNYTVTNSILVPTNCEIDLTNANITVAGSSITPISFLTTTISSVFTNSDHTNGNSGITLKGGYINGNGDNQNINVNWALVWFEKVSLSKIVDMNVTNSCFSVNQSAPVYYRAFCYLTTNCNNVQIINCQGSRAGYEVLAIRNNNNNIQVSGGYFTNGVVHVAQVADNWWNGAGSTSNTRFYGVKFESQDVGVDCLTFHTGKQVRIDNCVFISRTSYCAIKLIGVSSDIWITNSQLSIITGDGILIGEGASDAISDFHILDNTLFSNATSANDDCIVLGATSVTSIAYGEISGNNITTTSASCSPIKIQTIIPTKLKILNNELVVGANARPLNILNGLTNSMICDNTLIGNSGATMYLNVVTYCSVMNNYVASGEYGIYEAGASDWNTYGFNNLLGISTASQRLVVVGANTIINFNRGYVNENSNAWANTTATTIVITTGLAKNVTANFGVQGSFTYPSAVASWSWAQTSTTQITITVVADAIGLPASWSFIGKLIC